MEFHFCNLYGGEAELQPQGWYQCVMKQLLLWKLPIYRLVMILLLGSILSGELLGNDNPLADFLQRVSGAHPYLDHILPGSAFKYRVFYLVTLAVYYWLDDATARRISARYPQRFSHFKESVRQSIDDVSGLLSKLIRYHFKYGTICMFVAILVWHVKCTEYDLRSSTSVDSLVSHVFFIFEMTVLGVQMLSLTLMMNSFTFSVLLVCCLTNALRADLCRILTANKSLYLLVASMVGIKPQTDFHTRLATILNQCALLINRMECFRPLLAGLLFVQVAFYVHASTIMLFIVFFASQHLTLGEWLIIICFACFSPLPLISLWHVHSLVRSVRGSITKTLHGWISLDIAQRQRRAASETAAVIEASSMRRAALIIIQTRIGLWLKLDQLMSCVTCGKLGFSIALVGFAVNSQFLIRVSFK